MPIPFEALIPFGFVTAMFGVTGTLLHAVKTYQNDGKKPRYGLTQWDLQMMERDRRLTGSFRGQTSNPVAPIEFGYNSSLYQSLRPR
ncbi:9335_t:CDS:2 [Ambispora gerdemannii]|uniref:NADH dehydrogenase [ubiquinone] 1 alpha subcomplex subunit 1 n=1 Tax=Ambispora gerdemannii TaxID=144530 RepID=A0A9N9CZP8_9GLOM|nr:9335_t:CDS:2 [Ambispora gerdemannii]